MKALWQPSHMGALMGQIAGVLLWRSSDGGTPARVGREHWWGRSEDYSGSGRDPPPPLSPDPRATRPVTHRRRGLRREEAEEAEEAPPLGGDPRA